VSDKTTVTAGDIDRALTDKDLRGMRIVHFTLAGSLLSFALVAVVLQLTSGGTGKEVESDSLLILSGAHAFVALTCFGLSFALPMMMLKPASIERMATQRSSRGIPSLDQPALYVSVIRAAWILRLALQEGPAMFGLVICVLGVTGGQMDEQPLYWLNSLTTVLFLITAVMTIPSRERVLDTFSSRFSRRV
jgi:hypothetical protein